MPLLNAKETAQRLQMSRSMLYSRLKCEDFLTPIRLKGRLFFDLLEVEAYLRQCQDALFDAEDSFWEIGTKAVGYSGIPDHSEQLDHYLYGAPKQEA
jgi:predicted DNA-binding transcriptional regulator AlpA